MRKSALVILLVGAVVAATPGRPATEKRVPSGLQRVGGCGPFLAYAKQQALPLVGPYGLWSGGRRIGGPRAVQFGPPPPPSDFSTTNVQEEGVDEPDIVKTNGTHLFTVTGRHVHAIAARGTPRRLDRLTLPTTLSRNELLLHGTRLLVLGRAGQDVGFQPGGVRSPTRYDSTTTLVEIDVSDPSSMRIVRTLAVEGAFVGARLVDGVVRLVSLSSVPHDLRFEQPTGWDPAALEASTARNRELLAASSLEDWLPSYTVHHIRSGATKTRALVQCRHMLQPTAFSGLGLLSVLTLDLDRGLEVIDSDAIVGDGEIVYASPTSLYVATEPWYDRPLPSSPFAGIPEAKTTIHKFVATGRSTRYRGSGVVSGYLLNQWALSEHKGVLRVASTEAPSWWWTPRESGSFVTTLVEREHGLAAIGKTEALGRGERIYAVRFAGDTGYVVTFRQVDPLYTLDLSDPTRPRVRGELKILGYSAYLHPIGEDLVLGVGQDATEQGRILGTQLSLFDVSNPARPDRIHRRTIGRGSALVEFDHHAFLYWPPERLTVLPVSLYPSGGGPGFAGAVGFKHSRAKGFEEVGRVSHSDGVLRSVVVGDTLFTVSVYGVKANELGSFALRKWIEYPAV
jgi:Beta propeller domain